MPGGVGFHTTIPKVMPPLLQKLLMLQDHQLIRWGRLNGWATSLLGVLFFFISGASFHLFNYRARKVADWLLSDQDNIITFLQAHQNSGEKLAIGARTMRLLFTTGLEVFEVTWILFLAVGLILICVGPVFFRARSLAIEVVALRSAANGVTKCAEGQTPHLQE
jgi:hypothetical protein